MSKIPLSVFIEAVCEERDILARRVEAIDMLLSTYDDAPHEPRAKQQKKEKPVKHYKKGGVRHCKNCRETGHRSDNCPNGEGTLPPDEVPSRPEVTKEQVEALKEKGLNSIQIAARLKTSLSEVNKHW